MNKYLFVILFLISLSVFFPSVKASSVGLISNSTWQGNLTPIKQSSVVAGDIDNDNDLDIVLTGYNSSAIAKIYTNNGTSLIENSTWQENLTAVYQSSLALGDIDNDNDLDLILTGNNGTGGVTKVYINNGSSLIENITWEANLTDVDVYSGSVALGDINNDGRLDMVITGASSATKNGVYINNGTNFEKDADWLQSLPKVGQGGGAGAVSLGDIDNNGYLDIIFAGGFPSNLYVKVYTNNGTTLIENSTWEQNLLPGFNWPSIILGDVNNDGKLDLDFIGTGGIGDRQYFFINNGTTFVLNQTSTSSSPLYNYYDGSIAFGDYTNDGYLDLASNGKEAGSRSTIYRNNGTSPFFVEDSVAESEFKYDDMQQSSLLWIDIDNDNDLDLISTGMLGSGGTYFSKVYINNITTPNTVPNPPTSSFDSTYFNGQLTLTWGSGSDAETPTAGLYYNLRVGTCSSCNNTVSGVYGGSSNPTAGYFGNMMQRKSITLNIPNQTYYWSVQTIDTGLAKSSWSTEQTYVQGSDSIEPTITVHSPIDALNTSNTSVTFNVTVYDDVAVKNVTLYGNWSGWHENRTNSSGYNNTQYIFNNTLPEGVYKWKIRACDMSGNCMSTSNRTFIIDTTKPLITLISPSNASTWSSSSTVTFGYNVSDRAVANCSLIIDSAIDQTNTSITVNTTQTFSKSLSNAVYNWSINCTDYASLTNSSVTYQLTVSYTAPSGNGGTTGGSTGGAGGVPSKNITVTIGKNNATISIPSITANKSANVSIEKTADVSITQINITVKNSVNNVKITVEKLAEKPAIIIQNLTGKVYHFIQINKTNIADKDIDRIKIRFAVNKSWINETDINESTIALQRYTTSWQRLSTEKILETVNEITYEAESPGLSVFAITGEKITVPVEVCPICPSPSAWSECVASKQTRTNYRCSAATNYICEAYTEEQACVMPVVVTVENYYYIIGGIIVILIIVYLVKTERIKLGGKYRYKR